MTRSSSSSRARRCRLQRRVADQLARRRVTRAADLDVPARDHLHRHRVRRIVLGVALNLEDEQNVALGLVLGTAVLFTGIVLALGAILTPTRFDIPREYIVDLRGRRVDHARVRPARGGHRRGRPSCCSSCSSRGSCMSPYREMRRQTATFRNLEIIEEDEEDENDADAVARRPSDDEPVQPGGPLLGLAQPRHRRAGARRDHHRRRHRQHGDRPDPPPLRHRRHRVRRHDRHRRAVHRGSLPHRPADPQGRARDRHRQRHRQPRVLGHRQARHRRARRRHITIGSNTLRWHLPCSSA